MTVVSVQEEETAWLPGVAAEDVPEKLPPGVTLFARGGQLGIRFSGLVGTLPLRNGTTLHVVPKVGQVNFLRMLYRALGSKQSFDRQFEDFVTDSASDEATLPHLAARQVGAAAREILRRGATVRRVPNDVRGRAARGRLRPRETALALARHDERPVFARERLRCHDTPENRVICAALSHAAQILPESERHGLLVLRRTWIGRTTGRRMGSSDLELIEGRIKGGWYGGPRAYYQQALTLSLVLLGVMGVGGAGGLEISTEAHLMESASVFERYLRQVVCDSYAPRGYVVMKTGLVKRSLYLDGSFGLEPDVVIESNRGVELVMDAKYKTPDAGDHYQMLSYLRSLGVDTGVLLTPGKADEQLSLLRHRTSDGFETVTARLPLDDLPATEAFLGELLARI